MLHRFLCISALVSAVWAHSQHIGIGCFQFLPKQVLQLALGLLEKNIV